MVSYSKIISFRICRDGRGEVDYGLLKVAPPLRVTKFYFETALGAGNCALTTVAREGSRWWGAFTLGVHRGVCITSFFDSFGF
ncbi:hypothetical protein TIFTF001_010010 [Ficus carica]|uniref:Uncharacterized protein n=1 Tax=Ficus carica TaxID=3494 RepID=A0AA87ZVP4_FICCA|nr:hypothetical protein TIFTF001_010010 [Ficus carica]